MDSGSAWIAGSGHSSCRRSVSQKLRSLFSLQRPKKDLQFLKELVEAGKVTPIIDRTYRLSEVPAAIRYWETGHARGKIVIVM